MYCEEVGDDGLTTYAEVDVSKKKKKKRETSQPTAVLQPVVVPDDPMLEMYSVVDKSKKKHEEKGNFAPVEDNSSTPFSKKSSMKKPEPPPPFASIHRQSSSEVSEVLKNATTTTSNKSCLLLVLSTVLGGILVAFLLATFIISVVAVAQNSNIIHNNARFEVEIPQLYELIESLNASLASQIALMEDAISSLLKNSPGSSCADLPRFFTSGYYWISFSNGSFGRVYCNMTLSCGNITGGWMRVAELDMTINSHQCPSGLREHTDSNIRTCVSTNTSAGCSPDIVYTVNNINYTHVCGRIIGYQIGGTNAFGSPNTANPINIDQHYVDGISLTHGRNPREHIWTLAAARDSSAEDRCPCINSTASQPPSFVGTDYFCDTGSESAVVPDDEFFGEDPLWDGDGCTQSNTCCRFNTPPWFYRELPQPTTDDIEMRVCRNEQAQYENIAIELVDLYIQ